jgi:hypothetical protein
MLHRMKLRVVYGDALSLDKAARRRKGRVLLLAGLGVYLPFLFITYFIFLETRAHYLALMGFLTGLVCIPVAFYAYAKGFGSPLSALRRDRGGELGWLAVKIGFFYGFELFWMVLGIVEFLLGYHAFRAALISFVAIAVARDGFEIGYYRARQPERPISIFPDGRSILDLIRSRPVEISIVAALAAIIGALCGAVWGPLVPNPLHQALLVGGLGGLIASAAYVRSVGEFPGIGPLIRFFIWPAFTMAVTYFLIFAYLLRIIFGWAPSLTADQALLTGLVSLLMAVYCTFLGDLKKERHEAPQPPVSLSLRPSSDYEPSPQLPAS